MSSRSRLISRTLAGAIVLGLSAPAWADGMPEPETPPPAPKRQVVRHHVARHAVRHTHHRYAVRHEPPIGYVIKHVHEDLGAAVYVQPAWPSCTYTLDTFLVRSVRDSYTGHFDCGT